MVENEARNHILPDCCARTNVNRNVLKSIESNEQTNAKINVNSPIRKSKGAPAIKQSTASSIVSLKQVEQINANRRLAQDHWQKMMAELEKMLQTNTPDDD